MREFEAPVASQLLKVCKTLQDNLMEVKGFPHYHLNEKNGLLKDEIKRISNHINLQLHFLHEVKRIHSLVRHVKATVENRWCEEMYNGDADANLDQSLLSSAYRHVTQAYDFVRKSKFDFDLMLFPYEQALEMLRHSEQ